eukprot:TRINITY_DN2236_c0_g1_i2.p1 TRINITY_DN2236_c0_g1~~TRINITY_DN2236_c0_g1_i2.p1  ORF type:complete len:146 (-),score=3.60 TRINITY_DN2236_c0_g1_i2:210-614(-)
MKAAFFTTLVILCALSFLNVTYAQGSVVVPPECDSCIQAPGQTVPCGAYSNSTVSTNTTMCAQSCLIDTYTCCGCNVIGGRYVCGGCPSTGKCVQNPNPGGDSPLSYWCLSPATYITAPIVTVLTLSILALLIS